MLIFERHLLLITGSLAAITFQVLLSKARNAREFSDANAAKCTSNHLLGSHGKDSLAPSINLFSVATFR
jgi:hypothetical protein